MKKLLKQSLLLITFLTYGFAYAQTEAELLEMEVTWTNSVREKSSEHVDSQERKPFEKLCKEETEEFSKHVDKVLARLPELDRDAVSFSSKLNVETGCHYVSLGTNAFECRYYRQYRCDFTLKVDDPSFKVGTYMTLKMKHKDAQALFTSELNTLNPKRAIIKSQILRLTFKSRVVLVEVTKR